MAQWRVIVGNRRKAEPLKIQPFLVWCLSKWKSHVLILGRPEKKADWLWKAKWEQAQAWNCVGGVHGTGGQWALGHLEMFFQPLGGVQLKETHLGVLRGIQCGLWVNGVLLGRTWMEKTSRVAQSTSGMQSPSLWLHLAWQKGLCRWDPVKILRWGG